MQSTIHAAHSCGGHLSRHDRQELARVEAFSRGTAAAPSPMPVVELDAEKLKLID